MTDIEKINLIHDSFPVTKHKAYLNTGATGPTSSIANEALIENNRLELIEGRSTMSSYQASRQAKTELRQTFAGIVKASPEEIAVTHHTTEGMNIVSHGLSWQPGDELITTDFEHPGGFLPLYVLRQRQGVVLKFVEIPPEASAGEIVALFEAAITPRTRLMAFSHVAWNTGLCLPLEEIAAMGHRHHVLSLVDGAQSMGAINLDLPASGVDFYAFPGQKWLCGLEGIGGLYVRAERLSEVWTTFMGYSSIGSTGTYDHSGYFIPNQDTSRYEVGTVYRPAIKAMVKHLAWLEERIGWEWIYNSIRDNAAYAYQALDRLAGVNLITPPGPQAGLISFNLDGYDPARVMTYLTDEGIILRFIHKPYCLRISTGFYNTKEDIDRLVGALQTVLKMEPEDLPEFEPL